MIALFDANWLIYHAAWNSREMPVFAPSKLRTLLRENLLTIAYLPGLSVTDVIIVADDKSAKLKKAERYPSYKHGRADAPAITAVKEILRETLHEFSLTIPGYEADDIIAKLHRSYPERVVVSPDKDMKNLAGWHYNPNKKELVIVDEDAASYNFWLQMLMGDTTDGIPGIPKIGPKTGAQILQNCTTDEERCTAVRNAYNRHFNGYVQYEMMHYLLDFIDVPLEISEATTPKPIHDIINSL